MEQNRRDFMKTAAATVTAAILPGVAPTVGQAAPVYEVYAAKYAGPATSKLAFLLFNTGWEENIDRYYYIWAIKATGAM